MKSIALVILLTTAILTSCSNPSPDPTVVVPTIIELPTVTSVPQETPIIELTSCRLFNWWSAHYDTVTEYLDAFAVAYADPEQRVAITLQLNDPRYHPDQNDVETCSEEAVLYWLLGAGLLKYALQGQVEEGIEQRAMLDSAAQYLYALYRLDTNYAPRQLVDLPLLWGGATVNDAVVAVAFATTTAQMATARVEWTAAAFQTSEVVRHGTATALLAPLATRDASIGATLTASAGR